MQTRYSAEQKAAVLQIVDEAVGRTGWTVGRVLKRLGIPRSVYYEWRDRAVQKRLDDLVPGGRCLSALLPEEKEAVITYALAHPKEGYRRLAWMMVDADMAYVSPTSVYRVLTDATAGNEAIGVARSRRHRRGRTSAGTPTSCTCA